MNVKNRSTCNIDYRLIYDFTTIIWQGLYDLMQKCEKFRLARSARSELFMKFHKFLPIWTRLAISWSLRTEKHEVSTNNLYDLPTNYDYTFIDTD